MLRPVFWKWFWLCHPSKLSQVQCVKMAIVSFIPIKVNWLNVVWKCNFSSRDWTIVWQCNAMLILLVLWMLCSLHLWGTWGDVYFKVPNKHTWTIRIFFKKSQQKNSHFFPAPQKLFLLISFFKDFTSYRDSFFKRINRNNFCGAGKKCEIFICDFLKKIRIVHVHLFDTLDYKLLSFLLEIASGSLIDKWHVCSIFLEGKLLSHWISFFLISPSLLTFWKKFSMVAVILL